VPASVRDDLAMVPLIFLDIDGVLNSARYLAAHTDGEGVVIVDGAFDATAHVDPECVERLNRLVADTGASVVLSSSWRISFGMEKTQSSLAARGFAYQLADSTPRILGEPRHTEIRAYLSNYAEWPPFVILDDAAEAGIGLVEQFVHVRDGLEDAHIDQARAVLRNAT